MIEIDNTIETDVLVVGGGIAGALAALEARKTTERVILVSKGGAGKSGNTPMAEGGIQASFHVEDNPEEHYKDTMESGRHINTPVLVEKLVTEAPESIRTLEEYGVRFKKENNGEFFQFKTSGSSYPRCLWILGGGSGLVQPVVKEAIKTGVRILDDVMITRILISDNMVCGACGIDLRTGHVLAINAKSVVIATGGNESLYNISDGALDASGDGVVLAYEAGAELMDMEFIQFYPHALIYPESLKGVIIPEEVYYSELAAGKLLNGLDEEFAVRYDPVRKENTTRDVLARAIFTEISEGRGTTHGGVRIDLSKGSREKLMDLLPSLYNYLLLNGINMLSTQLEVAPSAHYQCGGIKINEKSETSVRGLFAAGECTGGINGANRLSSNALTEAVVFGITAGKSAADNALRMKVKPVIKAQLDDEQARLNNIMRREMHGVLDIMDVKAELQSLMFNNVGVVRNSTGLAEAAEKLLKIKNDKLNRICLKNRDNTYNLELLEYLELCNLTENAIIVTEAAQKRKESRGNHYRADYPSENNIKWKKNITLQRDSFPAT